jgi:hypothetical protein
MRPNYGVRAHSVGARGNFSDAANAAAVNEGVSVCLVPCAVPMSWYTRVLCGSSPEFLCLIFYVNRLHHFNSSLRTIPDIWFDFKIILLRLGIIALASPSFHGLRTQLGLLINFYKNAM